MYRIQYTVALKIDNIMSKTFGLDEAYWPQNTVDPLFSNREAELQQLHNHTRKHGGVIVITGIGGIGKTALLRQYLATADIRVSPLLMSLDFRSEVSISEIQQKMHELYERKEVPDIVALDNVETIFSVAQLEEISHVVMNYKRVRSLILVARSIPMIERLNVPIIELAPLDQNASIDLISKMLGDAEHNIEASRISQLGQGNPLLLHLLAKTLEGRDIQDVERFLNGEIYSLNHGLILPKKELIEVVKPKIITTNTSLVEQLQKSPQAVHDLSPRQYEEFLADLLDDMGYEVELTPATRDGGKDIMAYMNTDHGKILCLVEAKKYRPDRTVGVSLVRELFGTLTDANATSAMLVTTSSFSPDAKAFQQRHEYKLALRDYDNVVAWIDRYRGRH